MSVVKIIEVCSEIGAGTRGASLGADALRVAALNAGSRFFKNHNTVRIPDNNFLLLEKDNYQFARRIEGIVDICEKTGREVTSSLLNGDIPVLLAGDHSSAAGTIAGIKMAFRNKRLGVAWIDAHADLHSPYTTPSGHVHGMPLAAVLSEDNKGNQINKPEQNTVQQWEALKNIGGFSPKIDYNDLLFIGVRNTEPSEDHIIRNHAIKNINVENIREKGIDQVVSETLGYLSGCDLIYVSFDVDSLDSEISSGTGTPVPLGLSVKEAEALVLGLISDKRVCCFEICELNPTLDNRNKMAEVVFGILEKVTDMLLLRALKMAL